MLWRTLTLLCVVALSYCDDSEWREVRTTQGVVRGRKDPDGGLFMFYNIPYATVPVGTERFRAPLPAPVWLEPLDAIDKGIVCLQPSNPFVELNSIVMQEDCLVTNVFVPDTNDKDLPVIVYVHGGAFLIGYGDMISPKNFVKDNKVIVVNFNYRLGVHGFLCLGTEDAPGNAGLKDQVALLRWVKKNIASFGGNPNDVTIAGGSAGSISVDLLMLSKSATGLFNKVIPESGTGVASISVQTDPLENARTFAKMLNFTDVGDFYALQDFYKKTPLKSLLLNTVSSLKEGSILFSPCVERQIGKQVFLDDSPVNIIKKGGYKKVPILLGISNLEGIIMIPYFETWKNAMNDKFSDFLPADLQFENEKEKEEISKKVKEFYFGDKPVEEDAMLGFVDYYSDILFGYPTLRTVKLHVEAGHDQIYLYEYSFTDDSTPVVPFTKVRGATHCSQTMAILDGYGPGTSSDERNLSEEIKLIKATVREMWYNFAVHGKPVPNGSHLPVWPPSGANGGPYMSLARPLELRNVLLEERAAFWEDIYQRYYREPVPPPQPPPEKHVEL